MIETMASEVVQVVRDGRITVVTIQREEKRNAISADVTAGLDAAFFDVEVPRGSVEAPLSLLEREGGLLRRGFDGGS